MSRSKRKKFAAFSASAYALEIYDPNAGSKLHDWVAKRDVILELGCGKGAYTLALARKNPAPACIGVDIQGERLLYGARAAEQEKLSNVLFLRCRVEQLQELLPSGTVSDIWLTFPDPFPKDRHERRRLTSPQFLQKHADLLAKQGRLHLKTDSADLFNYSIAQLQNSKDFQLEETIFNVDNLAQDHLARLAITDFEERHRKAGKTIYYLRVVKAGV